MTIEVLNAARHATLAANRGRERRGRLARFPDGPPFENWSVSLEGGLDEHDIGTRLDA